MTTILPAAAIAVALAAQTLAQDGSVERVLAAYESARGGREAAAKVSTLHMRGTVEVVNIGAPGTIELFAKAPAKRAVLTTITNLGVLRTIFDGQNGWVQTPGYPPDKVDGAALDFLKRNADLMRDFRMRSLYREITPAGRQMTNGREAYVLTAVPNTGPPERWHFDARSGLVLRIESRTTDGLPSETNFEDFREVNGVRYPFVWREFTPVYQLLTRIEAVEVNVPLDDSVFAVR